MKERSRERVINPSEEPDAEALKVIEETLQADERIKKEEARLVRKLQEENPKSTP